ncbi:MAG: DNA polymerase III subunit delta [Gammaproteobacteria bacterium]
MRDAAAAFVRAVAAKDRAPGGAYIFYGEEPQLIEELRAALRAAGKYENVERASLELFGDSDRPDSRIAESPGDALFGGGAILYEITAHAPPTGLRAKKPEDGGGGSGGTLHTLQNIVARVKAPDSLAISFYGLDRRHYKAKWFSDLGKNAVAVHCARLDAECTAVWCRRWADEWQIPLSAAAAARLAEQTEGNLSAAKQCLQKICISGGNGGEEQVAEALSGGARFNIFHLADAALSGDGKKSLAILNVLLDIQEPPPLILWAISAAASGVLAAKRGNYPPGLSKDAAAAARQVAGRTRENAVLEVLRRAASADRIIKGVEDGDIKIALTDAVAALACLRRGNPIPTPPPIR